MPQLEFEDTYEEARQLLFGYLRVHQPTFSVEELEDIVAHTMAKAWINRVTFTGTHKSYYGWVKRIAINHIIDSTRSKAYKTSSNTFSLEEMTENSRMTDNLPWDPPAKNDTEREAICSYELPGVIERAYAKLNSVQRILVQELLDGKGPKQIAQEAQHNPSTVRVQVVRVRAVFREELELASF